MRFPWSTCLLVGVIGSRVDAISIKLDISNFLENKLKLKMSEEKTLITNSSNKARFLGFDITVDRRTNTIKNKKGVIGRYFYNRVKLIMPRDKWQKKLMDYKALKINKDANGKEIWEPIRRGYLKDMPDIEILKQYNSEIVGLYNYYSIANNASMVHRFKYVMEYSMYKTFAAKYESSVHKIRKKFNCNGKFAIRYISKKGYNILPFYNGGFKRKNFATKDKGIDKVPTYEKYFTPRSLISRLLKNKCEWCFKASKNIEVHHVRKLKSLSGMKKWEKVMIAKNRKTLVLCLECHQNLHLGLLD
ncbi:group II intron reverse transcriptase/maturase [Clostridium pasteurianum]|uniref:HNH endonuclease n=1 Tax=Clostridium pasteurianum TaxID=1501 RepID=UPI0012BD459A|nr:group II intron reverse transcriptase/maturase [Clostridium pasteurianum]